MSNSKTLLYALLNLNSMSVEHGFEAYESNGKIFISFQSGRNFELSDNEVKYRAIEYLQNQIEEVEHNN